MLIKEYRIPLPLTVEEYRIAQLYMIAVSTHGHPLPRTVRSDGCYIFNIDFLCARARATTTHMQKKSRDESEGAGSGVEILINEPYADGPGGSGQYTRKIFHVGSHLPGWIKGNKYKLDKEHTHITVSLFSALRQSGRVRNHQIVSNALLINWVY